MYYKKLKTLNICFSNLKKFSIVNFTFYESTKNTFFIASIGYAIVQFTALENTIGRNYHALSRKTNDLQIENYSFSVANISKIIRC